MMERWDREALRWLNDFVGRWPELDRFVVQLAFNDLLKGALTLALVFWAWASLPDTPQDPKRRRLLALGILLLPALGANRILASLLPFRPRPLYVEELAFRAPEALQGHPFSNLSAFPSDHAVMFCAFAFGLLFLRPLLGVLALVHAALFVLLPRLYLGLHWPSDLLAGAGLALVTVLLSIWCAAKLRLLTWIQSKAESHPGPAAAFAFLLAFGYATLFDPLVRLARHFTNG